MKTPKDSLVHARRESEQMLTPIGRSLFDLWALKGANRANYHNFQRITTGSPCRRSSEFAGGISAAMFPAPCAFTS
jgi:hypothetical protein